MNFESQQRSVSKLGHHLKNSCSNKYNTILKITGPYQTCSLDISNLLQLKGIGKWSPISPTQSPKLYESEILSNPPSFNIVLSTISVFDRSSSLHFLLSNHNLIIHLRFYFPFTHSYLFLRSPIFHSLTSASISSLLTFPFSLECFTLPPPFCHTFSILWPHMNPLLSPLFRIAARV